MRTALHKVFFIGKCIRQKICRGSNVKGVVRIRRHGLPGAVHVHCAGCAALP